MTWTLFKTVGTFSIFMDPHLLPRFGLALRQAERRDAKSNSTIHQMVTFGPGEFPGSPYARLSLNARINLIRGVWE